MRHSAIAAYADGTNLTKILSIREDSEGFPSQHWSTNLNLVSERNFSGWTGTSITMTPDLRVAPAVSTQLNWQIEGNESFFFPDEISLSCPKQVEVGKIALAQLNVVIAATWLVNSSYMQQITIEYDNSGAFQSLNFAEFT